MKKDNSSADKMKTPDSEADAMSGENGSSPGVSVDNLEALRAQLREAEMKRDQNLELAQRMRAEFENYQKRAARDLAEERRHAQRPLAGDLLPALDNLERATSAAQQAGEKGPLVEGVALVRAQLLDILRRHGITLIEAQDQVFDPNLHQAVMQQANPDKAPGTVLAVLEQGYMLHERVLRPARVVVSTAPVS